MDLLKRQYNLAKQTESKTVWMDILWDILYMGGVRDS